MQFKKSMMITGGRFHTNRPQSKAGRSSVRTLPVSLFFQNLTKGSGRGHLVVKMDVEGFEWFLMEDLCRTGALALVDELYLECHSREHNSRGFGEYTDAMCEALMCVVCDAGTQVGSWD